ANFSVFRENRPILLCDTFVPANSDVLMAVKYHQHKNSFMKTTSGNNSRRLFMGQLAAGTAAGFAAFAAPVSGIARTHTRDAESWFKKAKGRHRIVYDASEPHDGLPFIWSWV